MATDSGHPARKHNNSMAAVDNLHPSLLRKLGPKGPCSWTTCSHTLLEVDYCRETGCTNPVHHLCQGAWECAPGGTELGPGILRCPVHHKHFQATRNENTKPASSLTSALYKTPRSTDTTWTPAPSEQKKLSFSSKISFSTDQTHGRTTTTTPSSKTSSLTSSTAGSGLPKKPTKTPHTHKYQFAVKVCLHVPNCSHFATKCTNLLAYGLEKLQSIDPTVAYLKKKDKLIQARSLHELPPFQLFYNDWSRWEHLSSDFRMISLKNGRVKQFNGSVWLGSDQDPTTLLSSVYLLLDEVIPHGGGKVEFTYKELQEVDTKRDLILFGVPADIDTTAFKKMMGQFLRTAMIKMNSKNPRKYPSTKYGSIPNFAVLSDWLFNAPYQEKPESENIPFWCKKCIQFESRDEDQETLWNIMQYMSITKQDKMIFGEFARFVKGPGVGANNGDKQPLGMLLQSHIAIVRSLAKVPLNGLMFPDIEHVMELAPDAEGNARESVALSLHQIMMKRKIGKPHVWQCILPRHGGGWEGYHVNGRGCEEHRVEALTWSEYLSAHIRFYLLKRGVLATSMEEVINLSFTVNSAIEAFGAKLIKGKIFTAGTASAMNLARDLEGSWVDTGLGTGGTNEKITYVRKGITLRANTDPTAFNFSSDAQLPPRKDAGSVAFSEAGIATLGGSAYGNPNEDDDEDEGVTIPEDKSNDDSAISLSSDESDLWNPTTSTTEIIANITELNANSTSTKDAENYKVT